MGQWWSEVGAGVEQLGYMQLLGSCISHAMAVWKTVPEAGGVLIYLWFEHENRYYYLLKNESDHQPLSP
jgi:hypothetical protein